MRATNVGPIPDVINDVFEIHAARLRAAGEQATASINPFASGQVVIAIEVVRDGGDWQRSLVMTLTPVGSPNVDVRLMDDQQDTIAEIGEADVPPDFVADVALSLGRAGIARLLAEVAHYPRDASTPGDPGEARETTPLPGRDDPDDV